ncbi:MAG: M48 family metallopeptidase [Candidatus Pacearchaeota archaeon]
MKKKISFYDQIAKNKFKSFLLMIIVFMVIIAIGYLISLAFSPSYFFVIMAIASCFAILYVFLTYNNCEKIALKSVGAVEADPKKYPQLHNAIENMALAAGIPKPKVYIMKGDQINAFASGRDPKRAVICVTEGCINKLNKQELEGVIGHEISHIANYDIRFMTVVAVVVGAVSIFSQLFLRSLWFSRAERREGNAFLFLIAIVLAIIAPLIAMLIQFSISRKREFMADAGSVQLTRYPPGLIGALKKIKAEHEKLNVPGAMKPLFFSDVTKKEASSLLSTHPSIDDRIKALEAMMP